MSQPHESLVAWQRADELCLKVYAIAGTLPTDERFGLSAQMKRAAFSVAANIVEGYAFSQPRMRLRFLRISLASLAELGYALHFSKRVGFLKESEWTEVDVSVRMTAAPLHGLIKQQSEKLKRDG